MAQRDLRPRYLLGISDEPITSNNRHLVTWRTSKLGGQADFMTPDVPPVHCKLCNQELLLIVQIYAPLEGSPYHRTLYVFGCLSPSCSSRSEGWCVLRNQLLEHASPERAPNKAKQMSEIDWLEAANDWGEDDDDDDDEGLGWSPTTSSLYHDCQSRTHNRCSNWEDEEDRIKDNDGFQFPDILEENNYSRMQARHTETVVNASDQPMLTKSNCGHTNILDEQGNACQIFASRSIDDSLSENVHQLHVSDSMEGAVGINHGYDAEVEPPDEGTTITLDTPSMPSQDCITALFGQEASPDVGASKNILTLKSVFLAVVEETLGDKKNLLNEHERELLASYQRQEGVNINDLYRSQKKENCGGSAEEMYEKCFVKHGDRTFQKLQNRLGLCPQQLLRYCRDPGAVAILLASSKGEDLDPGRCQYCNGEMVFEVQLMPTVVDFMRIEGFHGNVMEFGTVIVYTCQKSCWQDGIHFREEKVIAMPDPDDILFRALRSKCSA